MKVKKRSIVLYAFFSVAAIIAIFWACAVAPYAPVRRILYFAMFLAIVLILLAAFAFIAAFREMEQQLNRLDETIGKINSGDMSARTGCHGKDKFSRVLAAFDQMVDVLCAENDELRIREERYRIINEQTDGVIFEYDIRTEKCDYTENWLKKLDFRPLEQEFLEQLLNGDLIHPDDLPQVNEMLLSMIKGRRKNGRCEMRIKLADGRYLWCSMRATTRFDQNGIPAKVVGKINDIDSRKRETEALKTSAQRDLLSKLYNKVTVERLIDTYLSGEGVHGIHALFIIDIDNFKRINDSLGHLAGDSVIKEVSEIVGNIFRESDICGRIGGDEIIILMKNFGTLQALATKAQALVEAMWQTVENESGAVQQLSCSVGISIFPRDGTNYIELFTRADAALYIAKANGKNQFYILEP